MPSCFWTFADEFVFTLSKHPPQCVAVATQGVPAGKRSAVPSHPPWHPEEFQAALSSSAEAPVPDGEADAENNGHNQNSPKYIDINDLLSPLKWAWFIFCTVNFQKVPSASGIECLVLDKIFLRTTVATADLVRPEKGLASENPLLVSSCHILLMAAHFPLFGNGGRAKTYSLYLVVPCATAFLGGTLLLKWHFYFSTSLAHKMLLVQLM